MINKGITYLPINTLPVVAIQSALPLPPLSGYLLPYVSLNRYLSRCSQGYFIFITVPDPGFPRGATPIPEGAPTYI